SAPGRVGYWEYFGEVGLFACSLLTLPESFFFGETESCQVVEAGRFHVCLSIRRRDAGALSGRQPRTPDPSANAAAWQPDTCGPRAPPSCCRGGRGAASASSFFWLIWDPGQARLPQSPLKAAP